MKMDHKHPSLATKIVAITGANGFIGSSLSAHLYSKGHDVRPCARVDKNKSSSLPQFIKIPTIDKCTKWHEVLDGVDIVVHAAARVHILKETSTNPLEEFKEINVEGTINLARQAAEAGVKRFIFLSSLSVFGSENLPGAFQADDEPNPETPYAQSKFEAEQEIRKLCANTSMDFVIIRPPMVYGPNAPGNFASMVRWLLAGVPLPFGAITENRRSFIGIDNLVDLLKICLSHPGASRQTFLASDGQDISTSELLHLTARAMGKTARLVPVPSSWLEWGAALLGKQAVAQRLCGSLQVDIEKTRDLLGWQPPLTLEQGLKKAVVGIKR